MKLIRNSAASATFEIASESKQNLTVMLASDIHYDSILCDISLFEKHLKLAEEKQAPVIIAGDFFDAMQGHDDPRRSMEELRDKYKVATYFDALVMDASAFLQKYKIPYYILALGNHETSVINKIGTNLCDRLAADLRYNGIKAEAMGYWGYIKFLFQYKKGGANASKTLYFHHGTSTNAPVTKGVINVNRQAVYIHDADIVLNGHNHHAYTMPIQVERLNLKTLEPYTETIWYLRTPGYKMSAGDSKQVYGYGPEKHREPTPRGCMFIDMSFTKTSSIVDLDVIQKIQ